MQQYLITTEEVSELSRDMSTYLDKSKIETYIRESENIDIKSALGDDLFLDVKKFPEKYSILLNGGIYETGRPDPCRTRTYAGRHQMVPA